MNLFKITLIVLCLFCHLNMFSQNIWKNDKHQFQVRGKYYHAFDGIDTFDSGKKLSSSLGFYYKRRLNKINYIGLSAFQYAYSFRHTLKDNKQGVITRREYKDINLSYFVNFITNKRFKIAYSIGLAYRYGFQNIFNRIDTVYNYDQTFYEIPNYLVKPINDFGLSIGLDNSFNITKWMYLNIKLDYSFFLIRKAKLDPNIIWDKNIPRNMLSTAFGLGFNFGNPELKKSQKTKSTPTFNQNKNSLSIFYSLFSCFCNT